MKKILFCLLLFVSSFVKANDIYIVGSVGLSNHEIWNYENFTSKDETDKALKLVIGYKINNLFSTEVGYADLGKGKFNHSDGSSGTLDVGAILVNLKINLLDNSTITPYLKVGASRLRNSEKWSDSTAFDKKTETNFYWALGAEYLLDKKNYLTFDYDNYGKSGAFNRNDWSTQPAGVKSSTLTLGIRHIF